MPEVLGDYESLEFSAEQKGFALSATASYVAQLSKSKSSIKDKTLAMFDVLDEINAESFKGKTGKELHSCKKGCAHCCHIQVAITGWEAQTILEFMKHQGLEFEEDELERLKNQALIPNDSEYILSPHRRCVFLQEDNTCGIYQIRPMSCRNYYVFNDPEDCNTFNPNTSGRTLVHFDINTLPPIMAMMELSGTDSMPRQLLKLLKTKAENNATANFTNAGTGDSTERQFHTGIQSQE